MAVRHAAGHHYVGCRPPPLSALIAVSATPDPAPTRSAAASHHRSHSVATIAACCDVFPGVRSVCWPEQPTAVDRSSAGRGRTSPHCLSPGAARLAARRGITDFPTVTLLLAARELSGLSGPPCRAGGIHPGGGTLLRGPAADGGVRCHDDEATSSLDAVHGAGPSRRGAVLRGPQGGACHAARRGGGAG